MKYCETKECNKRYSAKTNQKDKNLPSIIRKDKLSQIQIRQDY